MASWPSTSRAATLADVPAKSGRKTQLRACYRHRRQVLPPHRQRAHAAAVAVALFARLGPGPIAAYAAADGEVDLAPLIGHCWQRGIAVALPVIDAAGMGFASYGPDDALRRGRYGLLEPAQPVTVAPVLVLTPVVAFDAAGHRLGRGGGYYDRYLAAGTVDHVGIAHECQRASCLPSDDWDVPLPAVVTERGWQRLGRP